MAGDGSTTAFATAAGGFCWWLRLLFGLQLLSCLTAPVEAAQLGRDVLLWPGTEIEPASAASFLAGLAAWPLRLDVPMAVGGTLDDAATSMNLKPSEQEGPS